MSKKEIIAFKNVSFSYSSKPFLENINLSVYSNDFLGIIGPNGGGKTTLLRLLLGLIKPDSGKINVFGESPEKGREKIGYLSQFKDIDFDFPITVYEVVLSSRLGKSILKHYNSDDKAAAKKALKELGIFGLKDKKLNELSGGEKQRVFVARALINDPKVLVLDEPMTNLDMHIQEEFYRLLNKLNKKMAIIIVDHDYDMLSKHAKEIACINKCKTHTVRYHDMDAKKMKEVCHV